MRKERERQEELTEVWEERTDGVGNKFWVNLATRDTLLEHPVARAKRNAMHKAERARMLQPVRRPCLWCLGPGALSTRSPGFDVRGCVRAGLGATHGRGGAASAPRRD